MVNVCCNPFGEARHTWLYRNLRCATVKLVKREHANNIALVVGSYLCNNCRRNISRLSPPVSVPNADADNASDDIAVDIDGLEDINQQADEHMRIGERSLSREYVDKKEFIDGFNKLLPLVGVDKNRHKEDL